LPGGRDACLQPRCGPHGRDGAAVPSAARFRVHGPRGAPVHLRKPAFRRPLTTMPLSQPSLFADETEGVYCEVVVETPTRSLDRALTYAVPEALQGAIGLGCCVEVPLGQQRVSGYVVGLCSNAPPGVKVRAIYGRATDEDVLDEGQVGMARWLAQTCRCSLLDALRCFLPPGAVRKPERLVELTDLGRDTGAGQGVRAAPNQVAVLEALRREDKVTVWELGRHLGGGREGAAKAGAAVRALADKGFVREVRRLKRPAASAKTRQVATLAEGECDWSEQLSRLESRAPRQAEVVAALLAAEGECIPVVELPRPAVKALQDAGLVAVTDQRVLRSPDTEGLGGESAAALQLNADQARVVERVSAALRERRAESLLLHGVTGSGKTEVYLQCIQAALAAGRGAIVLVPEISLTPQAVGRFRARFGDRLALLHSGLGAGERHDEWARIRAGVADIVVGARSAVFAPIANLGIIVIDEEHEKAYKQDSEPRYSAQVVAAERARRESAVLILGSATPSLETYYSAVSDDGEL